MAIRDGEAWNDGNLQKLRHLARSGEMLLSIACVPGPIDIRDFRTGRSPIQRHPCKNAEQVMAVKRYEMRDAQWLRIASSWPDKV